LKRNAQTKTLSSHANESAMLLQAPPGFRYSEQRRRRSCVQDQITCCLLICDMFIASGK